MIPKEEQEKLPADENTPEKRAEKLWAYFNKKDNGKISEQESWPLYSNYKYIKYKWLFILCYEVK